MIFLASLSKMIWRMFLYIHVYLLNICLQMHVLGIWFCNEDKYFHVIKLWIMPIAILTPENLFMKLNPLFRVLIKRYSFSMLMQRWCLQQFKNVGLVYLSKQRFQCLNSVCSYSFQICYCLCTLRPSLRNVPWYFTK